MKFQTGVSKFQFKVSFSTSKLPVRVSKLGGYARFPAKFTNSIVRQFNEPRVGKMVPDFMFEERRDLLFFCLWYCPKSEKRASLLNNFVSSQMTDTTYE